MIIPIIARVVGPRLAKPAAYALGALGIGLIALFAWLAFKWWLGDVKKDAATKAVTEERTGVLVETINRMETADDTRREIRDDRSRARYDECMRSARNPANCQRFLPQ